MTVDHSGKSPGWRMADPQGDVNFELPPPRRMSWQELRQAGELRILNQVDGETLPPDGRYPQLPGPTVSPDPDDPDHMSDGTDISEPRPWVLTPSPPAVGSDVDELWHYTDAGGAIGILDSHNLWATSLAALNDTGEFEYGREMLRVLERLVVRSRLIHPVQKAHIQEVVARVDDVWQTSRLYAISASMAKDSLTQWTAYGGKTPHAIRLDPRGDYAILDGSDRKYGRGDHIAAWRRVLYDQDDQGVLLQRVLGYIAHTAPSPGGDEAEGFLEWSVTTHAQLLAQALAHCKSSAFSAEQEVRLFVMATADGSVRYRPSDLGVVEYVVVTGAKGPMRTVARSQALPVLGGAVGPFAYRETSSIALRKLLRRAASSADDVFVSAVSYR